MDFIDGIRLSFILNQSTKDDIEDIILNPDIKDAMLDIIPYMIKLLIFAPNFLA
jgi:hypothetical protein